MNERDQLILNWKESATALAQAKEEEARLRKEVISECFPVSADFEGTNNHELGEGYKLKAVFKLNRRLNNKEGEVDEVLTKMEKSGPEGELLADRIVKWEPKLSLTEYKELPAKFKKLIDEVLTTSPGTPSLSFVEPKSKK